MRQIGIVGIVASLAGCAIIGQLTKSSGATAKKYAGDISFHLENRTGAQGITTLKMAMLDDNESGDDWIGVHPVNSGENKEWKVRPGTYRVSLLGSEVTGEYDRVVGYRATIDRFVVNGPTRMVVIKGPRPGGAVAKQASGETVATISVVVAGNAVPQSAEQCYQESRAECPSGNCPNGLLCDGGRCVPHVRSGCPCTADYQCMPGLQCQPWAGGSQATCGNQSEAGTHLSSLGET